MKKKKMSYNDLEEHVITWAVDQLSHLQDVIAEIEEDFSIDEEKKVMIMRNFSQPIDALLDLITPLRHDEECLLEWAFNFVDQYHPNPDFSD